jgi:hypothetical protein
MRSFNFFQAVLSLWLVIPAATSAIVLNRDDEDFSNKSSMGDLDRKRAAQIRDAFQFAMDGYFEYAFPADELRPVNSSGDSNRVYGCGWGLGVVDSLDTAIIMELGEIVDRFLDFIDTINFTRTPTNNACRLFEINVCSYPPPPSPHFRHASLKMHVRGIDLMADKGCRFVISVASYPHMICLLVPSLIWAGMYVKYTPVTVWPARLAEKVQISDSICRQAGFSNRYSLSRIRSNTHSLHQRAYLGGACISTTSLVK